MMMMGYDDDDYYDYPIPAEVRMPMWEQMQLEEAGRAETLSLLEAVNRVSSQRGV